MTGSVQGYLLSVSAVAILLSLIQSILPQNAIRRIATFAGGLVLILAVISPVLHLTTEDLQEIGRELQADRQELALRVEDGNRQIMGSLIKENCEAYILDKAGQLGMSLTARVAVSQDGQYPVPVKAVLTGKFTPAQQMALSDEITEALGIASHEQEWRVW